MCVAMICAVFTSCDDDDGYWGDYPGYGYYDHYLTGTWQLVQINGSPIGPAEANYFSFYGNGNGMYYYHRGMRDFEEPINYWCNDTYADSYITIDYSGGRESQMQYWFSNGYTSLWMQWMTGSGLTTYRYALISEAPW